MYPNSQLTIQTPEQITMELAPAGIGSRFLALALDTVLQGVLYALMFLLGVLLLPALAARPSHAWSWMSPSLAVGLIVFIGFCVYWGYFAAFEILWNGQTPGKRLAGIRVVKDTGRPITAIEGIGRNLMRVVDGFCFYLVGIISVVLSRENKRLGDYVAGTVVIHDKKTSDVKPDWSFAPAVASDESLRPELARISEQDLIVIETFLHRRTDLEPFVRASTAMQLAQTIERKTGLAKVLNESDEDFLENTARQVREQARLR